MQMKKDTSIKNYKIIEAFVQCDFLDGFDYIDKAGEIVNLFTRRNKDVPNFTMSLPGLKITDLTDTIKELKISSNAIWIHFVEPKNLGDIETEASKIIADVIKIIKPSMFTRIGWRTYFAREFNKKTTDATVNLKFTKSVNDYNLENIVLRKKVNEYDLRLEISPVVKADDASESALLFDVDLGKKDPDFKIAPLDELKSIRQTLRSDEVFNTFEGLLR